MPIRPWVRSPPTTTSTSISSRLSSPPAVQPTARSPSPGESSATSIRSARNDERVVVPVPERLLDEALLAVRKHLPKLAPPLGVGGVEEEEQRPVQQERDGRSRRDVVGNRPQQVADLERNRTAVDPARRIQQVHVVERNSPPAVLPHRAHE